MSEYSNPNVLVSTAWVEQNKKNESVRIVEVDVDTKAYEEGHVEGAVGWNWQSQLCDTIRRDVIPKDQLEKLLDSSGIDNKTAIILYGDNNNWFACWAFWQLKIFGHNDVRIMNGGRKKWIAESRPLTKDVLTSQPKAYRASAADLSIRAFLHQTMDAHNKKAQWALVDVRSPDEYTGKILSPPGLPETCQRGGHIPGALSIPWGKNCNDDGTFKLADELKQLYQPLGVTPEKNVIAYCRIGERSSLSWFVLKYLLGYQRVMNYDGSWTEWGNLVNAPVAKGEQA